MTRAGLDPPGCVPASFDESSTRLRKLSRAPYEWAARQNGAKFCGPKEFRSFFGLAPLICPQKPNKGSAMAGITGRTVTGLGLLLFWFCATAAEPVETESGIELRIDAPTMMAALVQFSQQTGLQLLFPTEGATRISAPRVAGHLTPRAALEQLLRDSGLTFEFVNARTVSVTMKALPAGREHVAISAGGGHVQQP